jgi:RNase P protein component
MVVLKYLNLKVSITKVRLVVKRNLINRGATKMARLMEEQNLIDMNDEKETP